MGTIDTKLFSSFALVPTDSSLNLTKTVSGSSPDQAGPHKVLVIFLKQQNKLMSFSSCKLMSFSI